MLQNKTAGTVGHTMPMLQNKAVNQAACQNKNIILVKTTANKTKYSSFKRSLLMQYQQTGTKENRYFLP